MGQEVIGLGNLKRGIRDEIIQSPGLAQESKNSFVEVLGPLVGQCRLRK